MTGETAREISTNPEVLKRLAKYLAQQCFRNTILEDLHAVHVRQAQIDHEAVVREAAQAFECVGAVPCLGDSQTFLLEILRDKLSEIRLIFNNKDRRLQAWDHEACAVLFMREGELLCL